MSPETSNPTNIVICSTPARSLPVEICEHKGIGHPDSICDGVAEAVSRALSRAYIKAYGRVQHHNVDKALLVGGQSAPRFGGGKLLVPPRIIVAGRASALPKVDLPEFICQAGRDYLATVLHCDSRVFSIESVVRNGSASLQQVFTRGSAKHAANDTSFGAGFAPYSRLEETVLELARILRSSSFRSMFPAAGDDYKIMGARVDKNMDFTIALAFVDREVASIPQYFEMKAAMAGHLEQAVGRPCRIRINMLDDPKASDESSVYLTVTGLSAEQGDDGEVGRGNRVNGLITPGRTMSLEAAAGKNPISHVGKLYNLVALDIARKIASGVNGIANASVQILSTIGRPVAEPQLVAIELGTTRELTTTARRQITQTVTSQLRHIDEISQQLIDGNRAVF